jgi:hypothetical protein
MTKNNRQKLGILIALLGVLGIVLGFNMNQPATTAAVPPAEQKTSSNPPAPNDARIRLDLLKPTQAQADTGRRNVFQYYQPPPPPPPPRPNPANTPPPVQVAQPVQPRPPQPPQMALKYNGFAVTGEEGEITAFLADDARHYNVTAGEVLMGRYRILSITDKSVEVEDLELNRRQTLPLLK